MVQTEAQYKFVYLALQRYIQGEQLRLREQVGAGPGGGGASRGRHLVTDRPSSQREPREERDDLDVGIGSADPGRNAGPQSSRAAAA